MSIYTSQKILRQFSDLLPSKTWSFSEKSRAETSLYTHSYHRYPAKFIPQIVDKLIEDYTNMGETVLDPFGGCGTTLVESKLMGRESIGVDINPVAKLITIVKTSPINPKILERETEVFFLELNKVFSGTRNECCQKANIHERIDYWFSPETIHELNCIYSCIKNIKNQKVNKFFLVAFSHNLKNSSKWLMKSIKPTIDKYKIPQSPIKTFSSHLKSMVRKNEEYYMVLKERGHLDVLAKVYRKNATKRLPIKNKYIDLIVTSPPYVTSYEYADLHQLSLVWFGNDKEFKHWNKHISDFSSFRKNFIGTQYKNNLPNNFNSKIANNIVSELKMKGKSLVRGVSNYFADMNLAFLEMHRVLKRGGHACIVIGNTNLKGVEILNAEVAAEQMLNIGFEKVKFIKRNAASNKAITPWRDAKSGKFTSCSTKNKKIAYQYEYIIVMKKI